MVLLYQCIQEVQYSEKIKNNDRFYISSIMERYFWNTKKELVTVIEVIDNDEYLQKLNEEIQDLYSYITKNYNNEPVYFVEKKRLDKEKMLDLLERLINRQNEINDGSFVIDYR